MKAFKIALTLLLPAIASGLLESTLNEEDIVPDDAAPLSSGFERELAHNSLPGLTRITTRSTSSGKGKGKGGSKGSKGASEPQCEVYRVYYEKAEYRELLNEISTGKGSKGSTIGFSVDRLTLYDARSNVRVGFVTETNLITGKFDCTATGALSFAETSAGRSKDQMFYQGTSSYFRRAFTSRYLEPFQYLTPTSPLCAQVHARHKWKTPLQEEVVALNAHPAQLESSDAQRQGSTFSFRLAQHAAKRRHLCIYQPTLPVLNGMPWLQRPNKLLYCCNHY